MPNYIELDKQASFPASSNVGKLILGVNTNGYVTTTNSNGVTNIVGAGSVPYLEYTSKISNTESAFVKTKSVLNNTLNVVPVWVRTSSGNYKFKFQDHIDVSKAISNVPRVDDVANYSEILDNLVVTNNFGSGFNGEVRAIKIQSDGKILVGGNFTDYDGDGYNRIIRLNSDGSIDNTFSIGGGFDGEVYTIATQSDGKILVGGNFNDYDGTGSNRIIRLNPDGSIDNTFSIGGGFNDDVYTMSIQSDGKILVGGNFTDYNGNTYNQIIRLNPDGSRDTTFEIGSGFNSRVFSIIAQEDGKILVGGNFIDYDGTGSNYIIRLNINGNIDGTFNIGSGFNDEVRTIVIQSDGKVLVGGNFTDYDGTGSNRIIRLNTDGSIATSSTIGFDNIVYDLVIQSDNKIVCAGEFTQYSGVSSNYITRINSDFSVDSSFVMVGSGFNNIITSVALKSDGKIIVGGAFGNYNGVTSNFIELLNTDGYFGFKNGFNKQVYTIATQSDGKILVGGAFGNYNYTAYNSIIRLTIDGSIDNTFSIGGGFNSSVYTIATQSDGKILVGGNFTDYNGDGYNRIIRLNSDGSRDTTFSIGSGFNGVVNTIAIQSDGKILVGGNFTDYNGTGSNFIIRLNTDGSIDNTFSIGSGFDGEVFTIAIQSDDKILVGGTFNDYNGNTYNQIIRLNTDGSRDTTFSIGGGFNGRVFTIAIQSDDKILVGGQFTDYNGFNYNYIIRLNSDGSVDNTFSIGSGFNGEVYTIAIQSDGKILVGGAFGNYNGTTSNRIIRLNSDGSVNYDTIYGYDFDSNINAISAQSDWSIIVGGEFGSGDFYGNGIRKINNDINFNLFKADDILNNQPIEIRVYN
jgi:uncharacterized delta-60 repeat protein